MFSNKTLLTKRQKNKTKQKKTTQHILVGNIYKSAHLIRLLTRIWKELSKLQKQNKTKHFFNK